MHHFLYKATEPARVRRRASKRMFTMIPDKDDEFVDTGFSLTSSSFLLFMAYFRIDYICLRTSILDEFVLYIAQSGA